ncbi:hypothetical protein NFJ02_33g84010 [Pycnococcus provasolii]
MLAETALIADSLQLDTFVHSAWLAQQVLRPDVRGVRRRVERGGTTAAIRHALDSSLPRRNVKDRHMDQCLTNQWVGSKRSESSERFNLLTETCRKHGSFEYKGEQQCRFVLARTSAAVAQTSH